MIKQERYLPGHDPSQLPDFEPLVSQARSGNQEAFRELDDYLRPRLQRYFSSRLREEAEDLTQDTMMRITTNLDTFKAKGEGTYSQRFTWWCLRIAKNRLGQEFGRQIKQKGLTHMPDHKALEEFAGRFSQHLDEYDAQEELETQNENTLRAREKLKEKINEILPPAQREIVEQTLEGKSPQEIATQRGCQERSVICILSLARIKIEKTLLTPAGYVRAIRLGQAVKIASHRGRVPDAVQFLGMWYVTQEGVNLYQQTKRADDQDLINQGYVVLSRSASYAEATAIRRSRPDLLVFQKGKYYVRPESLGVFTRRKKQSGATISPPEGHHTLASLTQTQMESAKLREAARKGKLKAVKKDGYWFTTQESVDEFRQQPQEILSREGVIFSTQE